MSDDGVQADLAKLAIYFGEPVTAAPTAVFKMLDDFAKSFDLALINNLKKLKFL